MFYVINLLILYLNSVLIYKCRSGPNISGNNHRDRQRDLIFLSVSALQLILIMSLRGKYVGTDTGMYVGLYSSIYKNRDLGFSDLLKTEETFQKAPLWTLLMKGVGIIFHGWEQGYMIFTALFIIIFFWISFYISEVDCAEAVILLSLMHLPVSL